MTETIVTQILDLIDQKIESAHDDVKQIDDQRCAGFNYALGAFDELRYLKDDILELVDGMK